MFYPLSGVKRQFTTRSHRSLKDTNDTKKHFCLNLNSLKPLPFFVYFVPFVVKRF